MDIACILEKAPGSYLKNIVLDLEKKIVSNELKNDKVDINNYIINKYKWHTLKWGVFFIWKYFYL